ncbi:MAG TPA: carbon starvation CstA family protein [Phycisphaerales bacterium]|nr:carbon starvation CstA family protein [Phycisphaerales bacterium]HMP38373.1 carbon starvation CstA family protein [Phycisphaerales bacterium]
MTPLGIVLASATVLAVAYVTWGRLLARLFRLDGAAPVPSETLRDGVDFEPTPTRYLFGQHLSAIAAAGPIVGPILAGAAFGWAPALAWILVGCIFVGGVHDLGALIASVRHRARSIAEVVREHMSGRAYLLLLAFIYIALIYIIVAFADIVAASFVGVQRLEDGSEVLGPGIASTSVIYLFIAMAMGVALRRFRVPLWVATSVALPAVAASIALGQALPLDLETLAGVGPVGGRRLWAVLLLAYCLIAGAIPLWLLLQPRGHLGGWFMYAALFGGGAGLVIASLTGRATIEYPAFRGFVDAGGAPLVPILFITIACGACSGFHCLIASGTTSKQLRSERDALTVGYGAMLVEGMIAIVALCCVMVLSVDAARGLQPNEIFARGLGSFVSVFGIPAAIAISFALLAFTTFVYDTLDVCTRLGRFIVQELTGLSGRSGRWIGTSVTAALPLLFIFTTPTDAEGNPVPAWRLFWPLFGASNQLLAALALAGVTVWLWRTRHARSGAAPRASEGTAPGTADRIAQGSPNGSPNGSPDGDPDRNPDGDRAAIPDGSPNEDPDGTSHSNSDVIRGGTSSGASHGRSRWSSQWGLRWSSKWGLRWSSQWRTHWIWPVLGLPTLFMYVMSTWALLRFVERGFVVTGEGGRTTLTLAAGAVGWTALLLVILAAAVAVEAAVAVMRGAGSSGSRS